VIFYGGQLFEVPTKSFTYESGQPGYSRLLWYVGDPERLIQWAKHHGIFRYQPQTAP